MRVLAFSDLHLDQDAADQILAEAPAADLVIGAGDFAQRREGLAEYMTQFEAISDRFICVPGNNETRDELRSATSAKVLHGDAVSVGGLTVGGIGAAIPPLPPMPWHSFDLTEEEASSLLSEMAKIYILVSHSPPKGIADHHSAVGSIGSTAVGNAAERLLPQLLLCGRVHDSWGERGQIGATEVVNLGPKPNWFEVAL